MADIKHTRLPLTLQITAHELAPENMEYSIHDCEGSRLATCRDVPTANFLVTTCNKSDSQQETIRELVEALTALKLRVDALVLLPDDELSEDLINEIHHARLEADIVLSRAKGEQS